MRGVPRVWANAPCHELGVLSGVASPRFEGRQNSLEIVSEQRPRIEPQTGEGFGTMKPVRPGRHNDEFVITAHVPDQIVGLDALNDILEHSRALVVLQLLPQIPDARGPGNLPRRARVLHPRSSLRSATVRGALGQDPEAGRRVELSLTSSSFVVTLFSRLNTPADDSSTSP